jgi:hypothetical protein
MVAAVIRKRHPMVWLLDVVDHDAGNSIAIAYPPDVDVVEGLAIPIVYVECLPLSGKYRLHSQAVHLQLYSE